MNKQVNKYYITKKGGKVDTFKLGVVFFFFKEKGKTFCRYVGNREHTSFCFGDFCKFVNDCIQIDRSGGYHEAGVQ